MEDIAQKLGMGSGLDKIKRTLMWSLDKEDVNDLFAKIERLKALIGLAFQ
jgi:hypothetical protein